MSDVPPDPAALPLSTGPHDARLRQTWLLRYNTSIEQATAQARADLNLGQALGDERLQLRSRLLLERLQPQSEHSAAFFGEASRRLRQLGDRAGSLIARSMEIATSHYGGDVAQALKDYEALLPEIQLVPDQVERYLAMASGLYLYQAMGQFGGYMQLACQLMALAAPLDNEGLRMAAMVNMGMACYLTSDELQALDHLEAALSISMNSMVNTWLRFSVVTSLVEVHMALAEYEKARALLEVWSFPQQLEELDTEAHSVLHALGAETYVCLGDLAQAQRYLSYLDTLPREKHSYEFRCQLTLARALLHQARGEDEEATRLLLALQTEGPADRGVGERPMATRYWQTLAQLARRQGRWDLACQHLEQLHALERERKQQAAQARRIAARVQAEISRSAVEEAQRDQLTGLANRDRLRVVGDAWISRHQSSPAVVMMNLRRFNAINKALGRELGDAVLQAVADRLRELARRFNHAVAGRVYADQFALLIADREGQDSLQAQLGQAFAAPLDVAGQLIDLSAVFGLALHPQDGSTMQALMSNAEIALHEGRRGEASWTRFEPGFCHSGTQQLSLLSELRRAARQGEFLLMLQPKFSLNDERVSGAEALLRWQHPQRGLVPPMDFIPFAESTGSIRGITEWVLEAAMRQARALREAGWPCQLAVNISAHDIGGPELHSSLRELLARTGAQPGDLRLELTESVAMKDPAAVVPRMREISALGFEWSIDDFGTGQSSLAYLHTLPVSELKIDRSFVRDATRSSATLTLLKAAVELGANLGLSTVAEGVETAEDWALLKRLGCQQAQGWYGARPMPADDFIPWLRARAAGMAAKSGL